MVWGAGQLMAHRIKRLIPLAGTQRAASDPRELVWLTASAGTGKTHVLTARVLRLLLHGVPPETILCLTFTKAAAAEMADRIAERLAYWVRLDDGKLAEELLALGEKVDPATRARARTLFAAVIDSPGGGLRIQTIHAFCQTLLASFPIEAGLSPGFRPLEGREEAAMARATLAEMLVEAERTGDLGLIDDAQRLSTQLGEVGALAYLGECARDADAMEALGPRQAIEAAVRRALDVPLGDVEASIEPDCAAFDVATVTAIGRVNADWGTATGLKRADVCAAFVVASPSARSAMLADLASVVLTKAGERLAEKSEAKQRSIEPGYPDLANRLADACRELIGRRMRAALAIRIAAGLRAGQAYALAFAAAKRAAGRVGFDDLIRSAVALLDRPGIGEWVRYKLDRETDHILVDEAQDTNLRQWAIVASLASEYFAGAGARGRRLRTIFTVGDFKQAIFGFQGTDPIAFRAARESFGNRAEEAGRSFSRLSLETSFRSSPAILALVDRLIEELGAEALGLEPGSAGRHDSAHANRPGMVTILRPVSIEIDADDATADAEGEEEWVDDATRTLAVRIARQVRAWLDDPPWVAGKGRPLRPEDVMILVRKRSDLAGLIVARLHAEGVPVAGVDRLRLDAPLAVRDLMAALRFAAQPEDDLTLASLLVSPLFGLSHDDLHAVAFRREGSLWAALRQSGSHTEAIAGLRDILAMADFVSPHALIEHILSGPLDGRRRLMARLGAEARDPIEELVSAALAFESDANPSLQRFLDWFDRGEVDVKRDPSAPLDAVRVMTVHGAKGLQAPLVILADATGKPGGRIASAVPMAIGEGAAVPVLRPGKAERTEALARQMDEDAAADLREHWRLLYVAATRAEEHLVIAGALRPRMKGVVPDGSWYQALDRAVAGMGAAWEDDPLWGARRAHGALGAGRATLVTAEAARAPALLPDWLRRPAPVEARPPRPLAPSAIGPDDVADPPPGPALAAAARRGSLLHALFERLPSVAPDERMARADRWLSKSAGVDDPAERAGLIEDACGIIADPAFAAVFSGDALAEAPVAAVVEGEVIAGTVDRLLVSDDRVLVVDFKTGRRVPGSAEAVPPHHLRQMAAYVAALGVVFPGRWVEAALLYTSGPRLITLPPALLEAHKPGLTG